MTNGEDIGMFVSLVLMVSSVFLYVYLAFKARLENPHIELRYVAIGLTVLVLASFFFTPMSNFILGIWVFNLLVHCWIQYTYIKYSRKVMRP